MFTGITEYQGKKYNFIIEEDTLKIESADGDGFFWMDALENEKRELTEREFRCECFFSGEILIALTQSKYYTFTNNTMVIKLRAVIVFRSEVSPIYRMVFYSPELDSILETRKAFDTIEYSTDGSIRMSIKPSADTTLIDGKFVLMDSEIEIQFAIARAVSFGSSSQPVELHGIMIFKFDAQDSIEMFVKLSEYAKMFLSFLCYRNNTSFKKISLQKKNENGQFLECGECVVFGSGEIENSTLIAERRIPYSYIGDKACRIFQDIIQGTLYLRHVPYSYRDSRKITPARFVLIMAAFDWEFRKMYPNGLPKSSEREAAERIAKDALSELVESSSGKLKTIYKYLLDRIQDTSMQMKIAHTCNEFSAIACILGKQLYRSENGDQDFILISERLGKQRNNFAHGNIQDPISDHAILDFLFLERIMYAMQLNRYIKEETLIINAISELFNLNLK